MQCVQGTAIRASCHLHIWYVRVGTLAKLATLISSQLSWRRSVFAILVHKCSFFVQIIRSNFGFLSVEVNRRGGFVILVYDQCLCCWEDLRATSISTSWCSIFLQKMSFQCSCKQKMFKRRAPTRYPLSWSWVGRGDVFPDGSHCLCRLSLCLMLALVKRDTRYISFVWTEV